MRDDFDNPSFEYLRELQARFKEKANFNVSIVFTHARPYANLLPGAVLCLALCFSPIPMSGPLIESVRQTGPNCWSLGAKVECRLVEHMPPGEALATWSEGEH